MENLFLGFLLFISPPFDVRTLHCVEGLMLYSGLTLLETRLVYACHKVCISNYHVLFLHVEVSSDLEAKFQRNCHD